MAKATADSPVLAEERSGLARRRILQAMSDLAYENGYAAASVRAVCAKARVSSRAFYQTFDSREECFLAVLDEGYEQIARLISGAFDGAEDWRAGVLSALGALLSFFDSHPGLTRVWLVESQAAGSWAVERREHNIHALTTLIVERWPLPTGIETHPLASVGVMNSLIGIIQTHIIRREKEPLVTLLSPLMGLAATPYLDRSEVAREMRRAEALTQTLLTRPPEPATQDDAHLPPGLRDPRARRARMCLGLLAQRPGSSNRQIGDAIGITSHEQTSRLLARLARDGLLTKKPGAPGHPNAWSLTGHGTKIAANLAAYSGDTSENTPPT
jgi:AcrR family transcriptional regulator